MSAAAPGFSAFDRAPGLHALHEHAARCPFELKHFQDSIVSGADDGVVGRELWVLR